jgi:hypothetical protein
VLANRIAVIVFSVQYQSSFGSGLRDIYFQRVERERERTASAAAIAAAAAVGDDPPLLPNGAAANAALDAEALARPTSLSRVAQ